MMYYIKNNPNNYSTSTATPKMLPNRELFNSVPRSLSYIFSIIHFQQCHTGTSPCEENHLWLQLLSPMEIIVCAIVFSVLLEMLWKLEDASCIEMTVSVSNVTVSSHVTVHSADCSY